MTGMIWYENPNSRMLIRVLKRQLEHKFASCSMPSNPLNLWETNSSMWFSPPFLDYFPTGLPYVSLSGRFFRWPAVCWPPCAWSAAEARNRASKLWGITSSSFRCARGTGASWKHRGPRCQSFCRSLVFFLGFKLGPCWWGKPNIQWFIKFITICLISGFKFAISQYLWNMFKGWSPFQLVPGFFCRIFCQECELAPPAAGTRPSWGDLSVPSSFLWSRAGWSRVEAGPREP